MMLSLTWYYCYFTGFDFYDFNWVTEEEINEKCKDDSQVTNLLIKYLYDTPKSPTNNDSGSDEKEFDFKEYYEDNDIQKARIQERK
jgi:hypothetical protein